MCMYFCERFYEIIINWCCKNVKEFEQIGRRRSVDDVLFSRWFFVVTSYRYVDLIFLSILGA